MFSKRYDLLYIVVYAVAISKFEGSNSNWQSQFVLSQTGFVFLPSDHQALFLAETISNSWKHCAQFCHFNIHCRIFDYDLSSRRCRIFEGDIETSGRLFSDASFPESLVGFFELNSNSFDGIGQTCSSCRESRYLTCVNATCQCSSRTYYDSSKCRSQKLIGETCLNESECRQDLNYTCLPRQQCGPQSLQTGVLIAGYGNGTVGTALNALNEPFNIDFDHNDRLYIADFRNARVLRFNPGSSTGVIVAGNGTSGSSVQHLNTPNAIKIDDSLNLYVAEHINNRVTRWAENSSSGQIVAGGTGGSSNSNLQGAFGIVIDSLGNLYVADRLNHRVMKWPPNATSGIFIAGTGIAGSSDNALNEPTALHLDETNSLLYIADCKNHRIQLFYLNGSTNGITVAGGNGAGPGSNQLNIPHGLYVSNKTGDIYVADTVNQRIQLWKKGATSGLTIVGSTGVTSVALSFLNGPTCVYLNRNETLMYVCDRYWHRVLRFALI